MAPRLRDTMELKHRMDGDTFLETAEALEAILHALEDFLDYAEELTERGSTSSYTLIENSLTEYRDMFLGDVVLLFG